MVILQVIYVRFSSPAVVFGWVYLGDKPLVSQATYGQKNEFAHSLSSGLETQIRAIKKRDHCGLINRSSTIKPFSYTKTCESAELHSYYYRITKFPFEGDWLETAEVPRVEKRGTLHY